MTTSANARRSRAKGAAFEGAVARFLTTWWPEARRGVTNGWRTAARITDDPYDLTGTHPGLLWSLKNYDPAPSDEQCRRWLAQVEHDAAERGMAGLLVVKRPRVGKVDGSWCYRTVRLLGDDHHGPVYLVVRTTLREMVPVLLAEGYGPEAGEGGSAASAARSESASSDGESSAR